MKKEISHESAKARKISSRSRASLFLPLLLLSVVAACGGQDKRAKSPGALGKLAPPLAKAFKEDAVGDQAKAIDLYVKALDEAVTTPDDPASVAVIQAALDALVHRSVVAFSDVASTSALADRVDPGALGKGNTVDERLAKVLDRAEGPFAAHLVATARLALAERRGDAKTADAMRARSGCIRDGLLYGPLSWTPISGARENPAVSGAPGTALPASVKGPGPFTNDVRGLAVRGLGCNLPLYAASTQVGVREIVIDVEVPKSGDIGLGMRSSGSAILHAGGKLAVDRPYSLGASQAVRFARVEVEGKGTLRLVARVGFEADFQSIEIGAWDEDGKPLVAKAPSANSKGAVTIKRVVPAQPPEPKNDEERLAVALGALAARETRTAENLLHPHAARENAPAELLLAYARAVRLARDIPSVKSSERARTAYDRVLETWPSAWEAVVEHAVLAGIRRGHAEANIEAITDLEKSTTKTPSNAPGLVAAFEAATAGREHLYDRSRTAFDRAKPLLGGAPLLREVERVAFERTGREADAFECDPRSTSDKTSLACHHVKLNNGDRDGAERELERLRALAGTPQLYLSMSSRSALETGDLARAAKIWDAMNPGDHQLSTLYALKGKNAVPEIKSLAIVARDSPTAIPGLLRSSGEDPLALFEGIAEKVTGDDKSGPALTNAATAVLAHDERYDIDANGLIRFLMIDVRRVMGTTDVETNAQAGAPMLLGKDTVRILRRRIFKKDGRILLPDRTPHAAQSHADLSQLEAGDAVEAIYEGWGIPAEMGNIGLDTPDLLPERTAVRDARIELKLPQGIRGSLWSHPMLGKAEEKVEGGKRLLVWHVKDKSVRRIEYGVPKMDRNVGISFSTATWDDVAHGLRETMSSLDADSPEVSAWAKDATKDKTGKALVEALVEASGKTVKEASGMVLADIDLGGKSGQLVTARTALATHEGSRTWLLVRTLRELGIPTDVVVAENEPFSDFATFPPHFGRFMHPLAVAHVPDPKKPGAPLDVWIDADVPGPPLPAGRISPELRGRSALHADGKIAPLPTFSNEGERDEIDERLVIDDQGNAKGVLTVLLRGRAAQDLAEALVRLVGNERQRALRGIALGWVPFATVEKVELSSSEGSWQIAIRAELSAPAYAQVEGTKPGSRSWILPGMDPVHYVFPRPYVSTLSATYASQSSRDSALAINHASQYHVRRRVELPAKASIARLPGPFEGKGPLMSAVRKITVAGQTIEEDFTLDVTTGTIPKDRYDDFVKEIHKTDDAFRASTRVKPPTP